MNALKIAAALHALADAFADGTDGIAVTAAAPAAPSVADKVRDFLSNDTSGYDWRSANEIGKSIGHSGDEVAAAVRGSQELQSRNSTRGLGLLVSLRD